MNFPFICSNIKAAVEYWVDTIFQSLWSPSRFPFYGGHHTCLTVTEYLCQTWSQVCCFCRNHNPVISYCMTYHRNNVIQRISLVDQKSILTTKRNIKPYFYSKLKPKYNAVWKTEIFNDRPGKQYGNKLCTYRLLNLILI